MACAAVGAERLVAAGNRPWIPGLHEFRRHCTHHALGATGRRCGIGCRRITKQIRAKRHQQAQQQYPDKADIRKQALGYARRPQHETLTFTTERWQRDSQRNRERQRQTCRRHFYLQYIRPDFNPITHRQFGTVVRHGYLRVLERDTGIGQMNLALRATTDVYQRPSNPLLIALLQAAPV